MQQFTVGAERIALDAQGRLLINGRRPPLEGQECLVVVALLEQLARHQREAGVPLWVQTGDLQQRVRARTPDVLKRVVSEARAKVWVWGLDIKSVRGEGYFIWEQTD
jgi:hypothetical protein